MGDPRLPLDHRQPQDGPARPRQCGTCSKWVLAAWVHGLLTAVDDRGVGPVSAARARVQGQDVCRKVGDYIVFVTRDELIEALQQNQGVFYVEHEHRDNIKTPNPEQKTYKKPTIPKLDYDGPIPF